MFLLFLLLLEHARALEIPYSIPALPFKAHKLAPILKQGQVNVHYQKHHLGYGKKLNAALLSDKIAAAMFTKAKTLDEFVHKIDLTSPLYNHAAQVLNHNLFWENMQALDK